MLLWQTSDINALVQALRRKYTVIAPVQKEITRYSIVGDDDKVMLEQPLYPAKKFFLPLKEELFNFHKNKIKSSEPKIEKRIIILTKCDANALFVLDKILLEKPEDPYYKERRKKTMIIQFSPATRPLNYFGDKMDLIDFCDIKMYNTNGMIVLKPESHFGMKLLHKLKLQRYHTPLEEEETSDELQKKEIKEPNDNIWEREAKKCLSCSSCTTVCPTCCCFEIFDDIELEHSTGARKRDWSSCQQLDFTEVAGGHVFRRDRQLRVKHRILHKFKYFKDRFGMQMCVGCGRCITACPTEINIHEIIKELK